LAELRDRVDWVFVDELEIDAEARQKIEKQPAAGEWLRAYADLLEASDLPPSWPEERSAADRAFPLPSAPDDVRPDAAPCAGPLELEAQCREFAAERGIKFGHLVHPLRAALTGTTRGPGLFDCVFLLGKGKAVARLRAA